MAVSIRTYQETDFHDVLATINASARADGEAMLLSETALRARLDTPHDLAEINSLEDSFVAEMPGAGVVAYADAQVRCGAEAWLYRTQCFVRPEFRRRGIGRALMERLWLRAQELSGRFGGQKILLGAWAFDTRQAAIELFTRFSMRPVRYFFEMRHDLGAPIPSLQMPSGLQLLTWAERPDDRAIWAADEEAFADHWGHKPDSFERFEQRVNSGRLNREFSLIAWGGDQVAGGVLNDFGAASVERRGKNMGWVGMVFVRRPWRKRGLGRALLVASLLKAREAGHASVGLNVDAENLTGAVRLYESVGFAVAARRVAYQRIYPEE